MIIIKIMIKIMTFHVSVIRYFHLLICIVYAHYIHNTYKHIYFYYPLFFIIIVIKSRACISKHCNLIAITHSFLIGLPFMMGMRKFCSTLKQCWPAPTPSQSSTLKVDCCLWEDSDLEWVRGVTVSQTFSEHHSQPLNVCSVGDGHSSS